MTQQDLIDKLTKNPQLLEQSGFCGEWLKKMHEIYSGDFLMMGQDLATLFTIRSNAIKRQDTGDFAINLTKSIYALLAAVQAGMSKFEDKADVTKTIVENAVEYLRSERTRMTAERDEMIEALRTVLADGEPSHDCRYVGCESGCTDGDDGCVCRDSFDAKLIELKKRYE